MAGEQLIQRGHAATTASGYKLVGGSLVDGCRLLLLRQRGLLGDTTTDGNGGRSYVVVVVEAVFNNTTFGGV